MIDAFSRLHRKIQEAIHREGWSSLRPLQRDSIHAIHDTQSDLILAASTASGKTEAAFLPILSDIADDAEGGVRAIYIGPLKALINDQFKRLEKLCELADISVHRWHGDVGESERTQLKKNPSGVLLITPESLEGHFLNHDRHLSRFYSRLKYVVIDELHAFVDNVRGIHLRSLLARLGIAAGVKPRLVGLSATLGDFKFARYFLNPDEPDSVMLLNDVSQPKEKRVGMKAFYDDEEDEGGDGKEPVPIAVSSTRGLNAVAAELSQRFFQGANLVFCNSRRHTELLADKLRQMEEAQHWPNNPFRLHHGSLSKDIREDVEQTLKSGKPVTAICTSTLEMGIDIGSVRAVGQVGAPWTVASMVQRLGRSGREEGQPQILRLYTLDGEVHQKSSLPDRLFPELVRGLAMVELFREGWVEPPQMHRYHFSTAVHQVFSILRQTGGLKARDLYDRICVCGAFRKIDKTQFSTLLRGMAKSEVLEAIPTGELILSPAGERIVENRDFYAAFATDIEYVIEWAGQPIGTLPLDSIPDEKEFMLLAGRRWQVVRIDRDVKRVLVQPAKGWKKPQFAGGGMGLHPGVMARMRQVLVSADEYPYLHESGRQLLLQARRAFQEASLHQRDLWSGINGARWFPWAGTRVHRTLYFTALAAGLKISWDPLSLEYRSVSMPELMAHLETMAEGGYTLAEVLAQAKAFLRDRFDDLVDLELLQLAYAQEELDMDGARRAAASLIGQLRP